MLAITAAYSPLFIGVCDNFLTLTVKNKNKIIVFFK